jgi:diketogulonate reductase-like aldo/keto reductase
MAALYRNEADVGRAIADSGIHRSEIFVTTKLWTIPGPIDYNSTMAQLHDSLKKLNLQYVDLYLIHSPNDKQNRLEQWRALESAKSAGLAKSIGETKEGHNGMASRAGGAPRAPGTHARMVSREHLTRAPDAST